MSPSGKEDAEAQSVKPSLINDVSGGPKPPTTVSPMNNTSPSGQQSAASAASTSIPVSTPKTSETQAASSQAAAASSSVEPSTATPLGGGTLGAAKPPMKTRAARGVMIAAALMLLVGAGVLAVWQMMNSKVQPEKATNMTPAKKEVAKLSYLTNEGPLNSFVPDNSNVSMVTLINRQIFESLVAFENQNTIKPLLATSWTNPDSTTWLFKIKSGVTFHTGKTMEASDVVASLNAELTNKNYQVFTSTIKAVEVVDPTTVKITTKTTDTTLLNSLSQLPIYDTTSGKTADPINGTGPYTLKTGVEAKEDAVELIAFTNYHGGSVYTKELMYKQISEPAELLVAAKTGQYDIVSGLSTTDAIAEMTAAYPSAEKKSVASNSVTSLYFNTLKTGPLQKKEVREAITLAIDAQKVITDAKTSAVVADQIVSPIVPGFVPNYTRPALNVEKAKELLKNAGVTNLKFDMVVGPPTKAMATSIKDQLAAIGVTVTFSEYDDPKTFITEAQNGKHDSSIASFSSDLNDLSDVVATVYQKGAGFNNYENATVNSLMKDAAAEFVPEKRLELLQKISQTILDDYAAVHLRDKTLDTFILKPINYQLDIPTSAGLGVYFYKVYQK